jgi:3'-5' exoribonuclease
MVLAGAVVSRVSDLVDGQEAVCFAALVRKSRGVTKSNKPYLKCVFRDKRIEVESALWHDSRCYQDADSWVEGNAYRLHVQCRHDVRFGLQLDILSARPATGADAADGYDFFDLVPSSKIPADELLEKLDVLIERSIDQKPLKTLVRNILAENHALFARMPAAQNMHHSYTSGLLEHVWSMTRIASFLAEHYAKYYDGLDPPLNRGLIVAAAILHDIGKLRELEYHPVEAKYTKEGTLIGHVLMGRDMVREAAARIEGFPEELLLCLEHAILSHHGKREFGAPVAPATLEALIVSFVDDLDAKVNMVVQKLMDPQNGEAFTDKIFALENRKFYRGLSDSGSRESDRSGQA